MGDPESGQRPPFWPSLLPRKRPTEGKWVWRAGTAVVIPWVATLSKVWLSWVNRTYIQHHEVFLQTLEDHHRTRKYPLITVCNHESCLDDPGLWGALFPWRWIFNPERHRWSAAAYDICFTKPLHTAFFSFGKTFPIMRGQGIHQMAVEFATELLKDNKFLHVFPQGKVVDDNTLSIPGVPLTMDKVSLRDCDYHKPYELRWGLAHIILEYFSSYPDSHILVLPFYHTGMGQVLPSTRPYVPRPFNTVTITFREEGPIKFDQRFLHEVCFQRKQDMTSREKRMAIMDFMEAEMKRLKIKSLEFRSKVLSQ